MLHAISNKGTNHVNRHDVTLCMYVHALALILQYMCDTQHHNTRPELQFCYLQRHLSDVK